MFLNFEVNELVGEIGFVYYKSLVGIGVVGVCEIG